MRWAGLQGAGTVVLGAIAGRNAGPARSIEYISVLGVIDC
jgi:hypothetical protein